MAPTQLASHLFVLCTCLLENELTSGAISVFSEFLNLPSSHFCFKQTCIAQDDLLADCKMPDQSRPLQQQHKQRSVGRLWLLLAFFLGIYCGQTTCLVGTLKFHAMGDENVDLPNNEGDVTPQSYPSTVQTIGSPSLLPKRIIAVFGTESSGSTFLATTLGIATEAFPANGTYVTLPPDRYGNPGRTIVERVVAKRAMSPDRSIEIQHLSLPWGMWFSPKGNCNPEYAKHTEVVEALVPEECFRFEHEASWPSRLNVTAPESCREEAHISAWNVWGTNSLSGHAAKSSEGSRRTWSCGSKCGMGLNAGYALYPRRFFVNISSHVEWYLSRGVDITAIVSVRDRSISHRGKTRVHCKNETVALSEESKARGIMREALKTYGSYGRYENKGRVIMVSYEGLMSLKSEYLFDVYNSLGINSAYSPEFKDGNEKYVSKDN